MIEAPGAPTTRMTGGNRSPRRGSDRPDPALRNRCAGTACRTLAAQPTRCVVDPLTVVGVIGPAAADRVRKRWSVDAAVSAQGADAVGCGDERVDDRFRGVRADPHGPAPLVAARALEEGGDAVARPLLVEGVDLQRVPGRVDDRG